MYETMACDWTLQLMDYPAVIIRNCQTTNYCRTFILWKCRTIELSYYQTVIPKSAPITAMADFPFVRHCWLHFNILTTNTKWRSYSSISLLFNNPTLLVHIEKKIIKTGLCYLNYISWRVCFPKCPQSNWKKIVVISWTSYSCYIKDCMIIELSGYWAVGLMNYRSIWWCTDPRKFGKVITMSLTNSNFRTWQC